MIIYGALLIPFIVAFILYKYFSHQTVWWELFIPLAVTLIFTFSMKALIEVVQVSSKEYWGSFVNRIEYYEAWNEYIHQICTRSCGKNCTTTYNCSYVAYHSPYWQIITTTNETVGISQNEYSRLKTLFGNESFVELNRHYHTNDGDEYISLWKNDSATAIPVTTVHNYENRVKAADQSVFHFTEVNESDKKRFSLKEYPQIKDYYKMQSVIGDSSEEGLLADKKFQYINGLLGHKKEVKIFVLIFQNQPIDAAFYQESYWSGANMNEFVICVGTDKERNVKWCKPISWTRSELLKNEVKNFVQSQTKLNLDSLAEFTKKKVDSEFVRRSFKEFDYLTVDPPMWSVILTYILTLAINIGLSVWIIRNEFEE